MKSLRELGIAKSRFYAYANSKLIPSLLSDDGSLAIEDWEMWEVLNKYFASVFTKDDR